MNGVSAYKKLIDLLPFGIVIPSVIYTVGTSMPDYSIRQYGNYTRLFMGELPESDMVSIRGAELAADILSSAGLDAIHTDKILTEIWSKYILNCAFNVMTARWDITIGDIKHDPDKLNDYRTLMEEAYNVGIAMGVHLPDDLLEKHMKRLKITTDDSTSSLSRDFDEGRIGEMEIFSGEIVRMAEEKGVPVPLSQEYYLGLLDRAKSFT